MFLRSISSTLSFQKRHKYHTKRLIRSSLIVYLIALIINMVYPFDLSIVTLSIGRYTFIPLGGRVLSSGEKVFLCHSFSAF